LCYTGVALYQFSLTFWDLTHLVRRIALSRHWWEQGWSFFGYRFDERVL
jgi:hypothetical protein